MSHKGWRFSSYFIVFLKKQESKLCPEFLVYILREERLKMCIAHEQSSFLSLHWSNPALTVWNCSCISMYEHCGKTDSSTVWADHSPDFTTNHPGTGTSLVPVLHTHPYWKTPVILGLQLSLQPWLSYVPPVLNSGPMPLPLSIGTQSTLLPMCVLM